MSTTLRLAPLLLVAWLSPHAAAEPSPEGALQALEATLLTRLSAERISAGVPALTPHPALQRGTTERASLLAARDRPDSTPAEVTAITDRLWQLGYGPHYWREAVIAGDLDAAALAEARFDPVLLRPNLEHAAACCRRRLDGQTLCLLVVAERRVTKELRDAEPLRDLTAVRAVVLAEVNRHRAAEGRRRVLDHPALGLAAQRHAEAMLHEGFYDHRAPNGSSPRRRAAAARYDAGLIAENIAKVLVPPAEVVAQWMSSSEHRRNILLARAVHHGLGVAIGVRQDSVEVLWCELRSALNGVVRRHRSPGEAGGTVVNLVTSMGWVGRRRAAMRLLREEMVSGPSSGRSRALDDLP